MLSTIVDALGVVWLELAYRKRPVPGAQPGPIAHAQYSRRLVGSRSAAGARVRTLPSVLLILAAPTGEMLEARQQKSRVLLDQRDFSLGAPGGPSPDRTVKERDLRRAQGNQSKRRDLEETLSAPAYQRCCNWEPLEFQALCQETDRLTAEQSGPDQRCHWAPGPAGRCARHQ